MKRIDMYLRQDQVDTLRGKFDNVSEFVRYAIDEQLQKERLNDDK